MNSDITTASITVHFKCSETKLSCVNNLIPNNDEVKMLYVRLSLLVSFTLFLLLFTEVKHNNLVKADDKYISVSAVHVPVVYLKEEIAVKVTVVGY
jgi:hypothetical protein